MNDATQQALVKLTEKFGTNIDNLWGIMVRQAPIEATLTIFYILFFGILISILWKYVNPKIRKYNDDVYIYSTIMLAFSTLMYITISILSIPSIFYGYSNPEYWALQQFLEALKK